MLTAIEGVFRDGHIELREMPKNIHEARVIVTFLADTESTPTLAEAKSTPVEPQQGRIAPDAPATPEERLLAFQSLVVSLPEAPVVPLEALDREDLYT